LIIIIIIINKIIFISTSKIWKNWSCQYTLKGHTLAIWSVLGLSDNKVLTGIKNFNNHYCYFFLQILKKISFPSFLLKTNIASADKSIKLWENDKCIHTFVGHADCVRGLASISDNKFVSCSNDGLV